MSQNTQPVPLSTCVGCGATWQPGQKKIVHKYPCLTMNWKAMTQQGLDVSALDELHNTLHSEKADQASWAKRLRES